MTTFVGNNGVVKTAEDGGTVAAVTEVRGFSIESTSDAIECSVMGSLNRVYKAGMQTFTATMDFFYDPANDDEQALMVVGTKIDFELYPQGTSESDSVQRMYLTGSGFVTGRTVTNTVDGMVELSVTVQGSGALTEANIS